MERREEEKEEERKNAAQREEEEDGDEEEEEDEGGEEEGEEDKEEEEEDEDEGGEEEEDEEMEEERKNIAQGEEDEGAGDEDDDGGSHMKKMTKQKGSCPDAKCVPGIIYLGHIPPRLRPKHLRNLLSSYGEIGRIFLQPEDQQVSWRKRKAGSRRCDFTEGWVEFRDKRIAKRVAASLHNTPMGTKKRQRFFSDLWSIKYLHRFQWTHLSERLAYEQTVLQQRLRTEVSQAKRETNFYLNNVDLSADLDKQRRRSRRAGKQVDERTWDFAQRQTEDEIQRKKIRKDSVTQKHLDKARLLQQKSQSNVSLLAKIFNQPE